MWAQLLGDQSNINAVADDIAKWARLAGRIEQGVLHRFHVVHIQGGGQNVHPFNVQAMAEAAVNKKLRGMLEMVILYLLRFENVCNWGVMAGAGAC